MIPFIIEVLSVGLLVSAVLALFLDEVVYSVTALAGTFLFTALIYVLSGSIFAAYSNSQLAWEH